MSRHCLMIFASTQLLFQNCVNMIMNNTILNVLVVIAIASAILLIFLGVIGFLVIRQLQRFVAPNTDALKRQLDRLTATSPQISPDVHLRRIIHQQSLKCGLVGALTGLGGFITFPVALPVDLILSMRIQATLVQFIAMTYQQSPITSAGLKLQTHLITTGSVEVSETTFSFIMKVVARLLGESFSILIPAIGAIIGFIINYAIAEANGQLALRWYAGHASNLVFPALVSAQTGDRRLHG